jgi:hypothetical protein
VRFCTFFSKDRQTELKRVLPVENAIYISLPSVGPRPCCVNNGEEFQSVLLLLFFSQRENDDFNNLARRDGNDDDIPDAVVVLDDVPEQYQQLRNDDDCDGRRREIGERSNTIIEQQHIHGTKRRGAHNARGD